jgi:hypothetical protein
MSDSKNGAKSNGAKAADKVPPLIVFGRIRGSNLNQAAVFLKNDAEAAKKAASDAGLSSLEVKTEEHRQAAATLPEGAINVQGRFSLSPASPEIMAQLGRLLKAATGEAATDTTNSKPETTSATISADLWRQLKPGSLVLAAWFDKRRNVDGWWEAIVVSIDDDEFLLRWRDDPKQRISRSREHVALLHPTLTNP